MIGTDVDGPEAQEETRELAMRFLRVLEYMGKVARHPKPNHPAFLVGRLHMNQLYILTLLHREPGISQKDLAERMQLTPAAISTAVRELQGYKLIERRPDPGDARLMRLCLTASGQEIVEEGQRARCGAMADLLSALPLSEQRMIVEALERAQAARLAQSETQSTT